MNIAILGAGRIGGRLARAWRAVGHDPVLGVRDESKPDVQELVRQADVRVAGLDDAVRDADVIVLAVPHGALDALLPPLAPRLAGKIVIDCTNGITPDRTLKYANTTSAAEETARRLPGARLVKAFNAQGAETIDNPVFRDVRASHFYCGDDAEAKRIVGDLIASIGFEPIDIGPLKNARLIEPLTLLWFAAAAAAGTRDIAFKVLRR
jgi:NADPH-dependent F420 reductase